MNSLNNISPLTKQRLRYRQEKKKRKMVAFVLVVSIIVILISLTTITLSNNGNEPIKSQIIGGNKNFACEVKIDGYDYSRPVPLSDKVELDYFDDAVFIGDSRTEGFILNTNLSNTLSYTYKGLNVQTVFTKPVINKNGKRLPIMEALKLTEFSKVYIMFGVNETGWPGNEMFINQYGKIIDEVKKINPNAIIYVQSIIPVTKSISNNHSYVKNWKIREYNDKLLELANDKKVHYVNVLEPLVLSDLTLPEEGASDGIHLKNEYCMKWLDYILTHTVEKEGE